MVPTWQWSNTGSGVNQGFKRQITVRLVIHKTSHVLPRVWTWMYKERKKKQCQCKTKSFFVEYVPWCPGNSFVKCFLSFSHCGVTERKALYVSVQWMSKLFPAYCETRNRKKKTSADRLNVTHSQTSPLNHPPTIKKTHNKNRSKYI